MTLHLAVIADSFVIVVGDRLVTRAKESGQYDEYDPAANKTLLILGKDCTLAVAYTGLAYIDGVPTDQWLAGRIQGLPIPEGLRPGRPPMIVGQQLDITLNQVLERIRDGLEAELPGQTFSGKRQKIAVQVVGWRFGPNAVDPQTARQVMFHISHSGSARSRTLVRDWSSDATPAADGLRIAPELGQKLSKAVRADMLTALDLPAGADSSDVGAVLVGAIRSAAGTNGSIGTHCMTVCIARWQETRIRFNRDATIATSAYSPWILGRGFMIPPTTSNAGPPTPTWQDEGGNEYSITYEVDPPFEGSGGRWAGSQERTTWSPSSSERG